MAASAERVVEVLAWSEAGDRKFGSGYLVGRRLVLLTAHTLPAVTTQVKVRLPESPELRDAVVAWRGAGELDAALIEVTEHGWAGVEPELFGRITGDRRALRCTAVGFPVALAGGGGVRETYQLAGEIRPGSGRKLREYHISLDDHPGARFAPRPERTRWSGYSGAAVFCGDRLTGLVTRDLDVTGGLRLAALPMERLFEDPGFRAAFGDVPELRSAELSPFYPVRATLPHTPSSLLRPDSGVTEFRGRQALLGELVEQWLGSEEPLSVLLMTGPGGQGKTRFANELCHQMRVHGWETGMLARTGNGLGKTIADTAVPLLLVADYAETRTRALGKLLTRVARRNDGPRIRFLLLARTSGEWWDRFRADRAEIEKLLAAARVCDLKPLAAEPRQWIEEFEVARVEFAAALAVSTPTDPAPDLSGASTVLAVHMAALTAVLQNGTDAVPESDDGPETVLLRHEQRYWTKTAKAAGLDGLLPTTFSRLVAAATLCGAADVTAAQRVISGLPETADKPLELRYGIAAWLRGLYPADTSYWGPLQPDRLGEHLIALESAPHKPPFLDPLMNALLSTVEDSQVVRALQVLARASAHDEEMAEWLIDLVADRPRQLAGHAAQIATATERPEPLVAALERIVADPTASAADLEDLGGALHPLSQVLSKVRIDWVTRMITLVQANPLGDPADVTGLLMGQAAFQARAGNLGAAAAAAAAMQASARTMDKSSERTLALALAKAQEAELLVQTGEAARAREVFAEAWSLVSEYRTGDEDDDSGQFLVAVLLPVQANILWVLDENDEAASLADEAVTLLRRIIGGEPIDPAEEQGFLVFVLVETLRVLGGARQDLGDVAGGLAAHEEAIRLIEPLAAAYPDLFRASLPMPLISSAMALESLGRYTDALSRTATAISVLRDLSRVNPEAHRRALVLALVQQVKLSVRLGHEEAAVAAHEALTTATDPGDLHAYLFGVLFTETFHDLRNMGAPELAVAFGQDAVTRGLRLAHVAPQDRSAALVKVMALSALVQDASGDQGKAVEAFGECMALCRRTGSFSMELADLERLRQLGMNLARWTDARELCAEAVRRYAELPGRETSLVFALLVHWQTLNRPGEHDTALEVATRAINTLSQVPDGDQDLLGQLYTNRASTLMALSRPPEERLPDIEAALSLFRRKEPPHEAITGPLIAKSQCLTALSRLSESLEAAETAIAVARAAGTTQEENLAHALYQCVLVLAQLGRNAEADEYSEKLLGYYRAHPAFPLPGVLASLLVIRARVLRNLGQRSEEADELAREALELVPQLPPSLRDRILHQAHSELFFTAHRFDRLDEALGHITTALSISRKLPDHRPNVAFGLLWQANVANQMGRHRESEIAAREAVALFRENGAQPLLLQALNSLYNAQLGLGRVGAAVDTVEEIIAVARTSAGQEQQLLIFLGFLAWQRMRLGEQAEAAEAAAEAVEIVPRIDDAANALPLLGRVLAFRTVATGSPSPTAVEVEAALLAARPDAGHADLANGLVAYANTRSAFASAELSYELAMRAAELLRPLAATDPAQMTALIGLLPMQASYGLFTRWLDDPYPLIVEARTLAEPLGTSLALVTTVCMEANCLFWLGRTEDALKRVVRAVRIAEELPASAAGRRDWLAKSLAMLAMCHAILGDGAAGLPAAERALDHQPREWVEGDPTEGTRAAALAAKARCEHLLGADESALATVHEAIAVHRAVTPINGSPGLAGLAGVLTTKALVLVRLDRTPQARETAKEAVALWDRVRAEGLRAMPGEPERARAVLT